MRSSRGMGAISSSKMPNKKTITRTDNPDEVSMYKKGGSVKCYNGTNNEGSLVGVGEDVDGGSAGLSKPKAPPPKAKPKKVMPKKFNTIPDLMEDDGSAGMKKGGKVNAAGNYTKPSLRKSIVSKVMSSATQGTGAGQWSARKAQLVAKKYKAAGGGYKD